MALSKTIAFKPKGFSNEIQVSDAYHRVDKITGTKIRMEFVLGVYQDLSALSPVLEKPYSFEPNFGGDNFIKQAYQFLKTLPEFADAIDC